jgi:hypothetical protein
MAPTYASFPRPVLIAVKVQKEGRGGEKGKEKKRNQRQELQMMVGIIRKPTHKRDRLDRPAVGTLHPGKCFCTRRHATRSGAVPEECENKRNQRQQNRCEGRECEKLKRE